MKTSTLVIATLVAMFVLTGCLAGPNPLVNTDPTGGTVAGFWMGLWHGTIAPVTFFASLFIDHISVYEVHNNGGWYNFGFVLGAGILLGGGASSRK